MEKSKYGFNITLYPLLILLCVLFSQIWVALAIFGFALIVEKSERLHRMALHAALFAFVWPVYSLLSGQVSNFCFNYVPWQLAQLTENKRLSEDASKFFAGASTFFGVVGSIIFFAFVCIVILKGVLPLMKGKDMGLPFKKVADGLFGVVAPVVQNNQAPQYSQYPQQGYAPQEQGQPPQQFQQPQQFAAPSQQFASPQQPQQQPQPQPQQPQQFPPQ